MFSLDQMKLLGLMDIGLMLILVPWSKGCNWNINVTRHIEADLGQSVKIPCQFTYSCLNRTEETKVYWKKENGNNSYIYGSSDKQVAKEYRGRTWLIDNKTKGSCSLMISNVKQNISNIYVRVEIGSESYSFVNDSVTIQVVDASETKGYAFLVVLGILVSLVILVVIGVIFYLKHSREALGEIQDKREVLDMKVTDCPVYVNMEAVSCEMDPSADNTDNIYANIDHSQ